MTVQAPPRRREGYIRPMPGDWWLKRKHYTLFMIREFTSVFVGAYAVFLVVMVSRARDPESFTRFVEVLKSPVSIGLHGIALAAALYHSATWFNLTPKVMVIYRGKDRVPEAWIAAANYVAWIVVSAIVAWIVIAQVK